jgi:PPOX class probable F420-dependent enzyme
MKEMTAAERRAFLQEGGKTGKLATVRPDGRPHVAPIWFVLDGDDIIFTTWHETVKAANLEHDPRVAFVVDDPSRRSPLCWWRGWRKLTKKAPDMLRWTTQLAARYMGDELAAGYGRATRSKGNGWCAIRPTHFVARKGIAD